MKKLLLILLMSLSFGVDAYDRCYETKLTGKAFQGVTGEIVKTADGNIWEVKYDWKNLNAWGSNVRVCNGLNNSGAAYLVVKGQRIDVKRLGHSNDNQGRVSVEGASQAGAMVADGLFGILDALAGSSNKSQSNSRRLYEKGTTWQWNGSSGYGTDGLQCNLKDDYYFISCNNNVSYYICHIDNVRRTCGTDGTYYTSDYSGDSSYYCLTSNFGSRCCGSQSKKTCR